MERGDAILLLVTCPEPECAGRLKQTVQFSREELKVMLETGQRIKVVGSVCGHMWSLSAQEKQNAQGALETGLL
jgi:hypothetical protein